MWIIRLFLALLTFTEKGFGFQCEVRYTVDPRVGTRNFPTNCPNVRLLTAGQFGGERTDWNIDDDEWEDKPNIALEDGAEEGKVDVMRQTQINCARRLKETFHLDRFGSRV
ncbi:hypothetical protein B0H19DRAFT_1076691 [Mycena capillaripes]|nr:hypothetical protein B0H19DRAFT_1076691 [Mycena capillaripes]